MKATLDLPDAVGLWRVQWSNGENERVRVTLIDGKPFWRNAGSTSGTELQPYPVLNGHGGKWTKLGRKP